MDGQRYSTEITTERLATVSLPDIQSPNKQKKGPLSETDSFIKASSRENNQKERITVSESNILIKPTSSHLFCRGSGWVGERRPNPLKQRRTKTRTPEPKGEEEDQSVHMRESRGDVCFSLPSSLFLILDVYCTHTHTQHY